MTMHQAMAHPSYYVSPSLTFEFVAHNEKSFLLSKGRKGGCAVDVPRLGLSSKAAECLQTAEVAASFVEADIGAGLLPGSCRL